MSDPAGIQDVHPAEEAHPYLQLTPHETFFRRLEGLAELRGVQPEQSEHGPKWTHAAQHCAFAIAPLVNRWISGRIAPEVGSMSWPPLMVVLPDRPNAEALEALRLQGANMVVTEADLEGLFEYEAPRRLLRSSEWFQGSLSTVAAADVLQMLSHRSALLQVNCPHAVPIRASTWREGADPCTGAARCPGFVGRVYLEQGRIVHAETPQHKGLEALAQILDLNEGQLRVHEVFVRPGSNTVQGTTQQALLEAARRSDERNRAFVGDLLGFPRATRRGPAPPAWGPVSGPSSGSPGVRRPQAVSVRRPFTRVRTSAPEASMEAAESLSPVVRAPLGGDPVLVRGDGDPESLGAVGTLASEAWSRAGQTLGLGPLRGWLRNGTSAALLGRLGPHGVSLGLHREPENAFRRLRTLMTELDETAP
ncbi:MAG: DUF4388 domain-containing protein [Myxococcota bacterium]